MLLRPTLHTEWVFILIPGWTDLAGEIPGRLPTTMSRLLPLCTLLVL